MWGQQIIIENRGGGAHILGASAVANAAPDGHTLMVAEAGTFVINPALYSRDKIPFDPDKAFVPITGLVRIHHALVTHPGFPPQSVADVIALARAKPGTITYGTAGIGSGPHVNIARLQNVAGIKLVPVHYRGATPSLNDVMGGHTNMMLISVSSALPNFRAGQVKMLGIGSAKRLPQVPDVPTIAESGNLPGFIAGTWFGMAVTGGTPPAIVKKIHADVLKIVAEPAFRERFLDKQLYEPMTSSPEEFQAYIRSELQNWAKVIKEQNLAIAH
jgi:tripartite-type tricarboxylate transporter receptor subunit TctC